jgi:hypothetical protein
MAIESYGTVVKFGTGSPLEMVGEVISISGPGGSTGMIDTTHLASAAKEKLPDLRDEGQLTLECNFLPDDNGQNACRSARAGRDLGTCEIEFANSPADTATFSCYCTGFSISGGVGQQKRVTITLEITGAVAWSMDA